MLFNPLLSPLKRIASLITIVWQSAVPPTLCAVILVITYVVSEHFEPVGLFSVCIILLRGLDFCRHGAGAVLAAYEKPLGRRNW